MGKYGAPRFEFPPSSFPNFVFPASANSAMIAENLEICIHSTCAPQDNSPILVENLDILTDLSCLLAGNSDTLPSQVVN